MTKAKYSELDNRVLTLLKHGPCTPFRIAYMLHTDADVARVVLRRLKSQGLIEWRQESCGARLKCTHSIRKDPSPFPPPAHAVPKNVGWFG